MWLFLRNNKEFVILFLGAAIIRFLPLWNYQFSYDELSALSRTTYANWHDLVMYGARIDAHPVLIQCLLYAIIQLVGYSEVWIKLPFILMSLGAVYYAYRFSLKWFGKLPALTSASFFSFSFIFLYYSPLARMYASGVFFSTGLLYYWFNYLFDEKRSKRDALLLVLFFALSALNAHMGALFAFSLALSGLLFVKRDAFWRYLLLCGGVVVIYLPHLPITFFQLQYGGIGSAQNGWLPPPCKWAFAEFIKVALGTGHVWIVIMVILLFSCVIHKFKAERQSLFLIVLFFVNYAVIYAYSVFKAPIFQYSVMLYSAPAFLAGITAWMKFKDKWNVPVTGLITVVLLFQSLYKKDFFTDAVVNQNEYQYNLLKEAVQKYRSPNVEAVFFDTEKYFVMHYELRDARKLTYHLAQEEDLNDPSKLKALLRQSHAKKMVLGNPSPLQLAMAKEFFPTVEKFSETVNVSAYLLSSEAKSSSDETQKVIETSNWQQAGDFKYEYKIEKMNTQMKTFQVDSLNEFPFAFSAALKDISFKSGNIVLAKMILECDTVPFNLSFNCAVKDEKDSTLYFGGPEIRGYYDPGRSFAIYSEIFLGAGYDNWIKENARLTFFLWNRGKHRFIVKDASVQTIDFRPKRWALWE